MDDLWTQVSHSYSLPAVSWEQLLQLPLESLGLQPVAEQGWIYPSRPYALAGYTIQPRLFCSVSRSLQHLEVSINKITVHGLPQLGDGLKLSGAIRFSEQSSHTRVEQSLGASTSSTSLLAVVPRSLLKPLIQKALLASHQRMSRTLQRRLSQALGVQ
ncbi:DUF1997 domain-containing protein [Synechococcus sp. A10-1-5-1]|uniref:DUF1997 domain-containing protein n=1 Tax=Synechococcus sp. A10-1-5-1 TaxID=2936507 RepID=UPI002001C867|nr:DUF1997 domain-containing protein [Synechococcus sp. A10-1-5-1]UPM49166.1 DUF1997 domain-containing protein [Synechococcus sp. A10-1-5-1]